MQYFQLLALIVSGVAGAQAAAAAFHDKSLGAIRNSLAGVAGGGLGAAGLAMTLGLDGSTAGLLQSVAGGGLGGALLVILIGTLSSRWRR